MDVDEKIETLEQLLTISWISCSCLYKVDSVTIFLHDEKNSRILGSISIASDFSFSFTLIKNQMDIKEVKHVLVTPNRFTYKVCNWYSQLHFSSAEHRRKCVSASVSTCCQTFKWTRWWWHIYWFHKRTTSTERRGPPKKTLFSEASQLRLHLEKCQHTML